MQRKMQKTSCFFLACVLHFLGEKKTNKKTTKRTSLFLLFVCFVFLCFFQVFFLHVLFRSFFWLFPIALFLHLLGDLILQLLFQLLSYGCFQLMSF